MESIEIQNQRHFSTEDTAEKLGYTRKTVQEYILRGIIKSVKIRGRRWVSEKEIERLLTPNQE